MKSGYQWMSACAVIFSLALGHAAFGEAPTAASVSIENFTFKPAALTVKAGTTVTFINGDDIPHSIVAIDGSFHSRALDTGDKYTFTFKTTGDFGYFCGLHPRMTGHVTVTP